MVSSACTLGRCDPKCMWSCLYGSMLYTEEPGRKSGECSTGPPCCMCLSWSLVWVWRFHWTILEPRIFWAGACGSKTDSFAFCCRCYNGLQRRFYFASRTAVNLGIDPSRPRNDYSNAANGMRIEPAMHKLPQTGSLFSSESRIQRPVNYGCFSLDFLLQTHLRNASIF